MISQQEFQERRKKLAQSLPPNSVAILSAAKELIRNGDAHYPFRQSSHFYYLTGFNEPDAVLIVIAGDDGQSILFNRPRDAASELWTGKRLGQEGALDELNMQAAYPISSLLDELPKYLAETSAVYYSLGQDFVLEKKIIQTINAIKKQVRAGLKAPVALCDLEPFLSEMRLIKSEAEINLMRKAVAMSVEAHKRAMRLCKTLDYEYQLEAEFVYELNRHACQSMAYEPIVAGGGNACVLHYTDNNKALCPSSLVLIDAGGEYQGYAADITRTFPIRGQFSPEQRSIYELVLKAQKAGIALIKPGVAWNKVQTVIVDILTRGLCELGLLNGSVEDLIAKEAYKPFYMHNSGHWLGLDVHDCGAYKKNKDWVDFECGMVLTVEPGLYISDCQMDVDKRWRGIGVRIEDDVLVTKTGHEVLSSALPVEIDDIEAFMRE